LSKHAAYTPKHRGAPQRPVTEAPKKVLKNTLLLSTLAVVGTGTAVAGGLALHPANGQLSEVATDATQAGPGRSQTHSGTGSAEADLLAERRKTEESVSRSSSRLGAATRVAADRRTTTSSSKAAALASLVGPSTRTSASRTENLAATGDPKTIASALLASHGWSGSQFGCLVNLWNRESGWRVNAANPSGAYGIPQALPGSKMASAGSDWRTSAETQIKWGLGYIEDRYGSPCGAWAHSQSHNWY